jgi:hypothetical protein
MDTDGHGFLQWNGRNPKMALMNEVFTTKAERRNQLSRGGAKAPKDKRRGIRFNRGK